MIVDDDPDVSLTLKTVFYENSFKVDSFNDPILALKNFQAGSYDLFSMAINMSQTKVNFFYIQFQTIMKAFLMIFLINVIFLIGCLNALEL